MPMKQEGSRSNSATSNRPSKWSNATHNNNRGCRRGNSRRARIRRPRRKSLNSPLRDHCCSPSFEEVAYVNSSFAENRAQRALGHVSGMVRKRDLSPRLGMAPDFVAAGTGTVELETKRAETAGNFPGKSCEASHLRDRNRNAEFALRPNLAPEHGGEWIAVFQAGFHDFSGEALSDSTVSATLQPSATSPGTSGLVPK